MKKKIRKQSTELSGPPNEKNLVITAKTIKQALALLHSQCPRRENEAPTL